MFGKKVKNIIHKKELIRRPLHVELFCDTVMCYSVGWGKSSNWVIKGVQKVKSCVWRGGKKECLKHLIPISPTNLLDNPIKNNVIKKIDMEMDVLFIPIIRKLRINIRNGPKFSENIIVNITKRNNKTSNFNPIKFCSLRCIIQFLLFSQKQKVQKLQDSHTKEHKK